jgi:hypothetical protein
VKGAHIFRARVTHTKTRKTIHLISWRTFWALIMNVLLQLKLTNQMFPDKCSMDFFFFSFCKWNSCSIFVRTFQLHPVYVCACMRAHNISVYLKSAEICHCHHAVWCHYYHRTVKHKQRCLNVSSVARHEQASSLLFQCIMSILCILIVFWCGYVKCSTLYTEHGLWLFARVVRGRLL